MGWTAGARAPQGVPAGALCALQCQASEQYDVTAKRTLRQAGGFRVGRWENLVAEHRPTRKPHRSTDTRRGDSFGLSFQVLEAYRRGFRPVVGYELNPLLLRLSSFHAWRAGCYGKVSYCQEDFWKANLSDCNNVTVFLAPSVVPPLERKLLSELPDDACVVAARFPFIKWTPASVAGDGLEQAWAYIIRDVRRAEQATAGGRPREESNPVPEEEAVQAKGWREEH
uniref:Adenine nucleotide translocase lysine N-methyltransferase-like isoform X3 n=1 Tax=Pogona vitticeps TaxID=103695 RepID=A0ABM5F082_9SAUR